MSPRKGSKEAVEGLRAKAEGHPRGPRKRAPDAGQFLVIHEAEFDSMMEAGLSGSQFAVLLAMRLHAKPGVECWPSIARLCEKTKLSRRVVQLARAALIRKQLLRAVRRSGNKSYYEIFSPGDPETNQEDTPTRGEVLITPLERGEVLITPLDKGRSFDHPGGEVLITPPCHRGRSFDHPEYIKRKMKTPAHAIHDGRVSGLTADQQDKTARAGVRRLSRAVASLELVGVPPAELGALSAEHLGALSASDFSAALKEAERTRSVVPFREGRNGGSS